MSILVQQEIRQRLAEARDQRMTYAETRAHLGLPAEPKP